MSQSKFLATAESFKRELELAADILDKHFRNVRIARISGGTVCAVSSAVTIGSGIAIPFTVGISIVPMVLSIVFSSVAGAGGLTAGGASIFELVNEKLRLREMNKKWEQFRTEFKEDFILKSRQQVNNLTIIFEIGKEAGKQGKSIIEIIKTVKSVAQAAAETAETANAVETAATATATVVKTAARAGAAGAKTASASATSATTGAATAVTKAATTTAKTAVTGTRLLSAAGTPIVLLSAVSLCFSIYDIITASIDLHKKKKSKAGDLLREMAAELDMLIKGGIPTQDQVDQ